MATAEVFLRRRLASGQQFSFIIFCLRTGLYCSFLLPTLPSLDRLDASDVTDVSRAAIGAAMVPTYQAISSDVAVPGAVGADPDSCFSSDALQQSLPGIAVATEGQASPNCSWSTSQNSTRFIWLADWTMLEVDLEDGCSSVSIILATTQMLLHSLMQISHSFYTNNGVTSKELLMYFDGLYTVDGASVDLCVYYASAGLACPTSVGHAGATGHVVDTIPLSALLVAAGLPSLDAPTPRDSTQNR
jgi:hypothetical protein